MLNCNRWQKETDTKGSPQIHPIKGQNPPANPPRPETEGRENRYCEVKHVESSYFHLNRIRNSVLNNFKLWLLCVTEYFIKFGMSLRRFRPHLSRSLRSRPFVVCERKGKKTPRWRTKREKSALGNELHILSGDLTMPRRCNHNLRMKGLKGDEGFVPTRWFFFRFPFPALSRWKFLGGEPSKENFNTRRYNAWMSYFTFPLQ